MNVKSQKSQRKKVQCYRETISDEIDGMSLDEGIELLQRKKEEFIEFQELNPHTEGLVAKFDWTDDYDFDDRFVLHLIVYRDENDKELGDRLARKALKK